MAKNKKVPPLNEQQIQFPKGTNPKDVPESVTGNRDADVVIARAKKRIAAYYTVHSENIKNAVEDLKFLNLDQWPADMVRDREKLGRPSLVIDQLNKYCDQIQGDMRLNRARIKVLPADVEADVQTAKRRQGLIWNIEKQSNAGQVYDWGGQCATECGFGAWWVLTRYTDESPFLQEIYIQRLPNPLAAGVDPNAKDPSRADAKWGFILESISKVDYQMNWPKARMPEGSFTGEQGVGYDLTWDDDGITVCHYYEILPEIQTLIQLEGGEIVDEETFEKRKRLYEEAVANSPEGTEILGPIERQRRDVEVPRVKHYLLSPMDILEGPTDVPGRLIPIVVIYGRERNIEGKVYTRGLVRNGKDPQRLFNYWCTDAAEIVDMIPRNPWIATKDQIKGYEKDYLQSNVRNIPVMLYNPSPDAPPPHRDMIQQVPTAVFEQIGLAKQGVADAVGMFKPDVGDMGPERTGAAVYAKQTPGDVGSYVFIDNQRRGILLTGRIVNGMIDDIYDTERDVTVVGEDDTVSVVKVNTTASRAMEALAANPEVYGQGMDKKYIEGLRRKDPNSPVYNLSKGAYRVEIDTGPSFTTQRQEAAARLERLVTADPTQIKVIGDILYAMEDFVGSDKLAERYKKMLPPDLQEPADGKPPEPRPPDPDTQIKMKKLEVQQKSLEVKQANLEVTKLKFLNELQGANSEIRKVVLGVLREVVAGGGSIMAPSPAPGGGGNGPQTT